MLQPRKVLLSDSFNVECEKYDVCFSSDKHLAVTIEGDVDAAKTMEEASLDLGMLQATAQVVVLDNAGNKSWP